MKWVVNGIVFAHVHRYTCQRNRPLVPRFGESLALAVVEGSAQIILVSATAGIESMTLQVRGSARWSLKESMIVRPWPRAVLKVVIMVAATCSGIGYAQKGLLARHARSGRQGTWQGRKDSDETVKLAILSIPHE